MATPLEGEFERIPDEKTMETGTAEPEHGLFRSPDFYPDMLRFAHAFAFPNDEGSEVAAKPKDRDEPACGRKIPETIGDFVRQDREREEWRKRAIFVDSAGNARRNEED